MDIRLLMNELGAVATLSLGLLGLVRPRAVAAFTSIRPSGLRGLSEIRATYGGLFAALGAVCLLSQHPAAFETVGFAWLGAAVGRALSVLVDGSRDSSNLAGILFEAGIGTLLLV